MEKQAKHDPVIQGKLNILEKHQIEVKVAKW